MRHTSIASLLHLARLLAVLLAWLLPILLTLLLPILLTVLLSALWVWLAALWIAARPAPCTDKHQVVSAPQEPQPWQCTKSRFGTEQLQRRRLLPGDLPWQRFCSVS